MLRSSNAYTTFVVGFAIMMDSMIYTLVLPFLPELFTGRLHVPSRNISHWSALSFEVFALATLLSTFVVGFFTDAFVSKSRPFLLTSIFMPLSTTLFFLGTSPVMVVVSRAIQGVSVTFTWVTGLAFLTAQVGDGNLGACVGWTTAGVAMGEIIGPLVGGPIYDHLGHWAAFGVVEALLILDILLRISARERTAQADDTETQEQEVETQDDETESDRLLPNRRTDSYDHDPTNDETKRPNHYTSVASGIAWNWLGTVFTLTIIFMLRGALEVALPLYLLRQYSWTPTNISLTLLGVTAPAAANPILGSLTSRQGPRWWSTCGFVVCGAAMISWGFVAGDSSESRTLFVIHSAVVGIALAVLVNSNQVAVSVASQRYGPAIDQAIENNEKLGPFLSWVGPGTMLSGLTMSWAIGVLIGPAYSTLMDYTGDAGWAIFCRGLGGLCLVAAVGSLFLWRKW